ncbi:DUF1330 domain-containing protein [Pseudomonas costantinii]|uniref:Uncharacterized conserved protein, DUF1330 family n=1 Tax=Pseudomonas costantinii TaxID=168469 RepID=A0A1S2UM43_9PSED|nr:DUF1330 domain-containing protein [Pseudomonas costantinii]NVZ18940.1 DUF1330 domain-containing protein [Pseudomonas costantinii]OIN47370.1 hypothetical protein BFL40_25855 [Pseudomonas costantinii]SEE45325.1 Uncharacterized conserved protein, DUF1330 family [Pseudomonas costantinii]
MKKLLTGSVAAITLGFTGLCLAQDPVPHGYMIANYQINDQATFQRYMEAAGPLAPKYGGRVIVFNLNATAVEGKPKSVMAIAEFPSLADAQRFYNSPEYTAAKEFRIAATEGSVVITEGYVPAPQ